MKNFDFLKKNLNNNENIKSGEIHELKLEEKENLIKTWLEVVINNQIKPNNIDKLNNLKLKDWLYKSLIEDVLNIVKEWHLEPNRDLIEEIKNEKNLKKRSELELNYIKDILFKIEKFKKENFVSNKDSKWSSWPRKMKENKNFNCVGAALLGISLLDKIKVCSYYGNPISHALNIVKLSDGRWVYLDISVNKLKLIKPEEIFINGIKVLKLKEPDIIYHYIPLFNNNEIVGSIIGNLHMFKINNKINKKYFINNNFLSLLNKLYSSKVSIFQNKEIQNEKLRIEKIKFLFHLISENFNKFNSNQKNNLLKEIKLNIEIIKDFFCENNEKIIENFSDDLKNFLNFLLKETQNVKKTQPGLYNELVDLFLNNLDNLFLNNKEFYEF